MKTLIRNKLIALGFRAATLSIRMRRALVALGRPQLRGVDHITIPVHDLAVARKFYCEFLGASHLMTIDDEALRKRGRPPAANNGEGSHHISVLFGGETRVDLFYQRSGQANPAEGHPHYAFRVPPGELLKWKARLNAQGVLTEGPLQLGPPGQASLYFNDPSGNHLELVTLGFLGSVEVRPPEMSRLSRPAL
jgi:catechol 2,3-dioxygenase-like lactoylglutathione lyase family enzyme